MPSTTQVTQFLSVSWKSVGRSRPPRAKIYFVLGSMVQDLPRVSGGCPQFCRHPGKSFLGSRSDNELLFRQERMSGCVCTRGRSLSWVELRCTREILIRCRLRAKRGRIVECVLIPSQLENDETFALPLGAIHLLR